MELIFPLLIVMGAITAIVIHQKEKTPTVQYDPHDTDFRTPHAPAKTNAGSSNYVGIGLILSGLVNLVVFYVVATPSALGADGKILHWMYELGPWNFVIAIVFVGAGLLTTIAWRSQRHSAAQPSARPSPIGHTPDGQPIYPIVGYTPDGQPVTADHAVGLSDCGRPPASGGTNSMAIVALIMGLTVAPLGIVFGHIGLSQIKRTGEGGRGLAIAGLILGYIGLFNPGSA